MKYLNTKMIGLTIAAASVVTACGGGGGSTGSVAQKNLSGTIAAGSPIVRGIVTIQCANGLTASSQPSSSTGAWLIAVTDPVFPCAVQVNGGTINNSVNTTPLHSIALNAGTVNVSPLTDLMVAHATQVAVPSVWFAGLQSSDLKAIDASSLQAALSFLINGLQMSQLSAAVNPMTANFSAIAGNVIDDTLTALAAAMTDVGLSYSSLRSQVSLPNPAISSALTAAIFNQYANTQSGGGGTTSTPTLRNTTTGQAANGSPKVEVGNCLVSAGDGSYLKCELNAIANFGPVSVRDATTGLNCTASYVDGSLTVSNGTVSVRAYLNGNFLSDLDVFGTGSAITVEKVSGYSSVGRTINLNSVSWTPTGTVKTIHARATDVLGATTEFTCTN